MATYAESHRHGAGATHGTVPSSVMNAVRLMYLGAILALLQFLVGFLPGIGNIRSEITVNSPEMSSAQVDLAFGLSIGIAVLLGIIGAVLWFWMARKNLAGRNWARVLSTIFFGFSTLGMIYAPFQRPMQTVQLVFQAALWIVGLIAIVLIWSSSSRPHYATVRAADLPGQGGMPGMGGQGGMTQMRDEAGFGGRGDVGQGSQGGQGGGSGSLPNMPDLPDQGQNPSGTGQGGNPPTA